MHERVEADGGVGGAREGEGGALLVEDVQGRAAEVFACLEIRLER